MIDKLTGTLYAQRRRQSCYSIALIALLFVTTSLHVRSQGTRAPAVDASDRIELYQSLLDLTNPWRVMCVAAHPDDEDGMTLTVLRRKHGAHTVTLFSTYGEGGQNAIGPELYEDLGAIRARETLRAAEIQGSEANFLALRDFGFSKNAEEAFRIWGHDEALRRMVSQIRQSRPDVIITNHDTLRGHGHHQATGRLIEEAFDAAADAKRFPEQLKETSVWQVQRLFVRISYDGATGGNALEEEAERAGKIITINPNEMDAVRGQTYAEQALKALQQHASQGPWPVSVPKDGARLIRYRLARQSKTAAALPMNPQTVYDGLVLNAKSASYLTAPTIEGRPLTDFLAERERVFQTLLVARKTRNYLSASAQVTGDNAPRFTRMVESLNNALLKAGGIKFSLTADDPVLVPGTMTTFTLNVSNQGDQEVSLELPLLLTPKSSWSETPTFNLPKTLSPGTSATTSLKLETPLKSHINIPQAAHLYDGSLFGERYTVATSLEIAGAIFPSIPVATIHVDFAPAVEIASITPSPLVLTPQTIERASTFNVRLVNHQSVSMRGNVIVGGPTSGHIKFDDGVGMTSRSDPGKPSASFKLEPNEPREVKFEAVGSFILIDTGREQRGFFPNLVSFTVKREGSTEVVAEQRVPVIYSDARVTSNLRVGYVRSFDDTLRNALDALGVESKELKVEDVSAGDLQKYDTIIIDNRGYQAHPKLIAANARLLEYARNGGTLLVFYHKTNEWNPDAQKTRPQLAPLPITLGNERVTDETAAITFKEPRHPLLNFPNKIGASDFNGWVQERGLYYPKTWDASYHAPLMMSDEGEAGLNGGLLTLDYGRGRYIYTSMVWYRQLRAGIPGAYRMFANMISYGRNENVKESRSAESK